MACEICTDPNGESCYPIYGLAPHIHLGGKNLGTTKFLPQTEWPSNFRVDPEDHHCGVWWCIHCGEE